MYIDIHTHKSPSGNTAIYNVETGGPEEHVLQDVSRLFSVGIHPWNAAGATEELFEKLAQLATGRQVVIIGECGLDKYSSTPLQNQIQVFERQIQLSEKLQKPLIIHCVGCFNELFEIKKRLQSRQLWIIHGFRGKPELARQILQAGCTISFGAHFNPHTARAVPTGKLFVETDESSLAINEIYARIAVAKSCAARDLNAGELLLNSI